MNVEFRAAGKRGEIWLYDQVGESFWGEGISAKAFQKELTALGRVDTINLRINSPGGDVFDGIAIFNQLKSHPARVIVDIDGLAASIASVIAMCGDEINIASNAMMMIHNPHGMAVGDAQEMQRVAALLTQVKDTLTGTYRDRTGIDKAKLSAMLDDETWLSADTAVQHGFADRVTGAQQVSASFDYLARFRNVPAAFRPRPSNTSKPARDRLAVRTAQMAQRMASLGIATA